MCTLSGETEHDRDREIRACVCPYSSHCLLSLCAYGTHSADYRWHYLLLLYLKDINILHFMSAVCVLVIVHDK